MTTEEVPLAAQIEKVQREIRYAKEDHAERGERLWSAVLASLQQHERLTADLAAANERIAILERENVELGSAYHNAADLAEEHHRELGRANERIARLEGGYARLEVALNAAPILSKYHGQRGFEYEGFIADYGRWRTDCRASISVTATPAETE